MSRATDSQIERSNLLSIFKATLKNLLDSCLPHHSSLDDENACIRQLLVVLQHILFHSLQERSSLSFDTRNVWSLVEMVAARQEDMQEGVLSIRGMSNVRTPLGKLRVWMHIALMQKKLSEHFNHLLEHHTLLCEYYQTTSIMRSDESAIIAGLLSSLNFLDYVFISKDEAFDLPLQPIDFSPFIESNMALTHDKQPVLNGAKNDTKSEWAELVSQKRYLEEINESLSTRLNTLEKTLLDFSNANSLLKEELFASRGNVVALQKEVGGMQAVIQNVHKEAEKEVEDKDSQLDSLRQQLQDVKAFNLSEMARNADLEDSVSHKQAVVARVEEKCQQLSASLTASETLNSQLLKENTSLIEELERLRQEVVAKESSIYKLSREGEMEKGRRVVLEGLVEEGRIKVIEMEGQLKVASQIRKENEILQQKLREFDKVKLDQEQALVEIASVLSHSKLQVDSLEEGACEGVTWVDDELVSDCYACSKVFSVSRRKHHCRRCGQIFCADCSNHKATLPNHCKPARVCTACHTSLQACK